MDHRKLSSDGVLKECGLLLILNLRLDLGIDKLVTLGKGDILQGIAGCYLGIGRSMSQPQQGVGKQSRHQPPVAVSKVIKTIHLIICL